MDQIAQVLRVWASTPRRRPDRAGRPLQQKIKRIGTALRTHDRAVLAEYEGFNTAVKKSAKT